VRSWCCLPYKPVDHKQFVVRNTTQTLMTNTICERLMAGPGLVSMDM
jgi:hypothetical protein